MAYYYAVVAPNIGEVNDIIQKFQKGKNSQIAGWLESQKNHFYGRSSVDWKPFGGSDICKIVKSSSEEYLPDLTVLSHLNQNLSNIKTLNRLQLLLIDPIAMLIDKYAVLADKLDWGCTKDNSLRCCFWIGHRIPEVVQMEMENLYRERWPSVADAYPMGMPHRLVVREDDLMNYLAILKEDLSNRPLRGRLEELAQSIHIVNGRKPTL